MIGTWDDAQTSSRTASLKLRCTVHSVDRRKRGDAWAIEPIEL